MALLLFQHTFLPTSIWSLITFPGIGCVWSGIFSLRWLKQHFTFWGLPEVDLLASSCSTQYQHYYTLESPLPLGVLGLNAFNHPWMFQVSYMFPPPALVPLVLSKFPGTKCQRSTQIFDSGGTMLNGGSLAPHSSQHVGRHSSVVSCHKRSCCGCLSRPSAQGSAISGI